MDKTMKRYWLALLLLAIPLLSFGQAWSLDDCVDYAIAHNPDILHRQLRHETQKEVAAEAASRRVPVILAGLQETMHSGNMLLMYSVDERMTLSLTSVAASLEMPLLTGGSIPNNKNAELYTLKASAEEIEVAGINLRIRVAAAYLQLLHCMSLEQIAREQIDLCNAQIRNVTKLVEQGRRTNADLAEAKSALSSAEYQYTTAAGNTLLARVRLANLIGLDEESGLEIQELREAVEETDMIPLLPLLDDIENHPSVLSARYNLTSAEYRAKAAKGIQYPQLSLFANYNNYIYMPFGYKDFHLGDQLAHNGWGAVGLKLSVPILNMSSRKKVSRAALAVNDAAVSLDASRKEIDKLLREAWYQALTAKERYRSSAKAEAAALTSYESQQKLYDAGRSSTYDLDQSRLKWSMACEETVRAKYEYLLRNKILGYYSSYSQK